MFKDGLLKGKNIPITGGGTGLGKEIAEKYLQLGADWHKARELIKAQNDKDRAGRAA